MKKIFTYAAVAAAALAAVSCSKENLEINPEGGHEALKTISVTVGVPDMGEMKSSLEAAGGIEWEADDEIGVWDGTALRKFVATGSGPSVVFTGEIAEDASELYAKYPYDAADTWAEGVITTCIPSVQTAVAGSFAKGANVSVAKGAKNANDNWTFSMKNVCSYFKFTLENGDRRVKSVTLSSHDSPTKDDPVYVTGRAQITVSGTEDPINNKAVKTGTHHFATLVADDPLGLGAGTYYIAVLPYKHAEGISLTFTSADDKTAFLRKNSEVTFGRNTPAYFNSAINTGSSLSWLDTKVIELDFSGGNNPFNEELDDTRTAEATYTLKDDSSISFGIRAYMSWTSAYGRRLFYGAQSSEDQSNLQYITLPAIGGKRLVSVDFDLASSSNLRSGVAAICENTLVGPGSDSLALVGRGFTQSVRVQPSGFGWYDLVTTENTAYKLGNKTAKGIYGDVSGSSKNVFGITKMRLVYVGGEAPAADPTLVLNFDNNVLTATVDQSGATVYYETSETSMEDVATPTTSSAVLPAAGADFTGKLVYVKAIAVKGTAQSSVVEKTCDGKTVPFGTSWSFESNEASSGTFYSEFVTYCEGLGGLSKFVSDSTFTSQNLTIKNIKDDSGSFSNTATYLKYNKDVPGLQFTFKSASAGKGKLSVKLNARSSGNSTYIRFYDSTIEGGYKQETVVYDKSVPTTTYSFSVTANQEIKFSTGKCLLYNISWEADTTE